MSKILIKNGKVWDGERFYFADILTEKRAKDGSIDLDVKEKNKKLKIIKQT